MNKYVMKKETTTMKQYESRLANTVKNIDPNGGFVKTLKVLAKR